MTSDRSTPTRSYDILSGIRIADFTRIFAGPLATQVLADLGADVVKIERVDGGDDSRHYSESPAGTFLGFNRDKRSLAVDLSTDEGREVARRLVRESDVVVENFRDGVMRSWALDYDSLRVEQPDLIYCAISGFGRHGAMADRAANDLLIQAYSGLLSFQGEPDRPPVRCATSIADFSAGLYAAVGILGAILHKKLQGEGQYLEISLLDAQTSLMNHFFIDYWLHGAVPKPLGTANRLGSPNQVYKTKDGWIVIAAVNEAMWVRCCAALDAPELADDPRFNSLARRHENSVELVAEIENLTVLKKTATWLEILEAKGVAAGPVRGIPEMANDAEFFDQGSVSQVGFGERSVPVIGSPLRYSKGLRSAPVGLPLLGEQTDAVLTELGYTVGERRRLFGKNIVARA